MAVTGFWPVFKNLKATLDYADNPDKTTALEYLDEDLYAALRYAENDNKTDRKIFVGGINCSAQNAYAEMIAVQRRFGLPILAQGGDLTLNFTDSSTGIALSGDTPHPKGLTLSCPGVTLPEDCPREGLLAYLVEQGAVHWQDVRVLAAACHSTGLVL